MKLVSILLSPSGVASSIIGRGGALFTSFYICCFYCWWMWIYEYLLPSKLSNWLHHSIHLSMSSTWNWVYLCYAIALQLFLSFIIQYLNLSFCWNYESLPKNYLRLLENYIPNELKSTNPLQSSAVWSDMKKDNMTLSITASTFSLFCFKTSAKRS